MTVAPRTERPAQALRASMVVDDVLVSEQRTSMPSALCRLYEATYGSRSRNNTGWCSDADVCTWYKLLSR